MQVILHVNFHSVLRGVLLFNQRHTRDLKMPLVLDVLLFTL
jgi:hypothetical protein